MIEGLLGELIAAERIKLKDGKLAAIGFTALLDGLWLAWCLNPAAFRPAEGVSICRMWVEGLRRGAHG
jgi:hypothetical protein